SMDAPGVGGKAVRAFWQKSLRMRGCRLDTLGGASGSRARDGRVRPSETLLTPTDQARGDSGLLASISALRVPEHKRRPQMRASLSSFNCRSIGPGAAVLHADVGAFAD